MRKAFVCLDGEIVSTSDGQKHRIPGDRLPSLYGVNSRACVVARNVEEFRNDLRFLGAEGNKVVVLRPREDGKYSEYNPYAKIPTTGEILALGRECNKLGWVFGDARAIFADALQDADYQDELLLADLRSDSNDIDMKPFIDWLYATMLNKAWQSLFCWRISRDSIPEASRNLPRMYAMSSPQDSPEDGLRSGEDPM